MDVPTQVNSLALVHPTYVREDERGSFIEILNRGPWETVITGFMRPGGILGNHYHKKTRMFLYLLQGSAEIWVRAVRCETDGDCHDNALASVARETLATGQGLYLEPNQAHAIRFLEESSFLLLKSRRYSEVDPDTFLYEVMTGAEVGRSG
ncbi:MAG: hypothetical protein AABZ47_17600 [Planctomycetota bacterium]